MKEKSAEEILGFSENREQALRSYAYGLEAYRLQRWGSSIGYFSRALTFWPDDSPSKVMLERCNAYSEEPPPEDWDGVFQHTRKR
ncbi:MAG: hypothetical protein H8E10_21555 [Desulfobacterales bacterium]|nr:hypothetical protein [Desulfobacterales bacterium]MBL7101320.1 hypothetical protein [Desulfobacteraceae bacterium]MBL7171251.1 hypothetical protein [Desulfobacteraceae bacterium]